MSDARKPDFELWQALHSECDEDSTCCEAFDIEIPEGAITRAAALGMSVEAYTHMAVHLGLMSERTKPL